MSDIKTKTLISCEALHENLGLANLKIFDVRGGWGTDTLAAKSSYLEGHIPNAVFLDWRNEFIQPDTEINLASVASENEAKDSFRNLGINHGDTVVLYDDYHHMQAGRIWWAMRRWGFENVHVLDGGWNHWQALDLEISKEAHFPERGNFEPLDKHNHVISLASVDSQLGNINLIDARGPVGFGGSKDDPRSGHIPTAVNIPFSLMLDPDSGLFKSKSEIGSILAEKFPSLQNKPIVSSCGAGYAGTVLLLAFDMLNKPARLFDGSFSIWKQDPKREIEQGPFHNV